MAMLVENIMYFALGFLGSALLWLMIAPAIWARAVRLTKKRIEAATPMTLTEFRADKDQLRAEFAMSTRRLELNVETLRQRLGEQLEDINRGRAGIRELKDHRDQQLQIVRELEDRETTLRTRISELEREGTRLAARLRQRDRELDDKTNELNSVRASRRKSRGKKQVNPKLLQLKNRDLAELVLSGDYANDVEDLLRALDIERQRADFLERHNTELTEKAAKADTSAQKAATTASTLRSEMANGAAEQSLNKDRLIEAESRIAHAESQFNALLEKTATARQDDENGTTRLLAEKLELEEELEKLREKVTSVETTILNEWTNDRLQQSHLRERLNDIAADVSRLVDAVDGSHKPAMPASANGAGGESLFETVQKFAPADPHNDDQPPADPDIEPGSVSDRITALRDLHPN
jgi:DNA repair exonuclease SbcCD ATPase subunit